MALGCRCGYFVGAGEEHRRHLEAEGLRSFQIDDKFELD